MKRKFMKQIVSIALTLVLLFGLIPMSALTVHAGHPCPDCNDWIDGAPYCSECYRCQTCINLCIECGVCEECSGSEICEGCSNEEVGDTICTECAIDKGSHCPDCNECYIEAQSWCAECGACESCTDICDGCSLNLGKGLLCVNCAAEGEGHCPGCGGCYFEIQGWCEECMLCTECVPTCEYCSIEEGKIICVECAISEGLHCTECSECYGEFGGDRCEECGICAGCVDICSTHDLCVYCAIDEGYHCQNCEACGEDEVICEGCNEVCSNCADEMCKDCNLCSECVQICPGCGACSNCVEICENCGEYCSDCEGLCDDCNLCVVCCEDFANFEGCDCSDWVCIESDSWNEHFEENHTETEEAHYARPVSQWSWSVSHHWHNCVYCDDSSHHTNKDAHTYDANNTCTVCGYVKDAKIMILKQPEDVKHVYVPSPDETYDEKNIAHFSVQAAGIGKLTYTWCRRYYVNGQITYKPLSDFGEPLEGECFEGPELSVLAPTDACCDPLYICCIITDEEGNEIRTREALLEARHHYQYYALWRTHEWPFPSVSRGQYGHILQCVGECCNEKTTSLRPHEDDNHDRYCDICDYEIEGILITKQPKDCKNVYVRSADETYDESNIAHFSVEASGDSELTYTWCRRMYVNGELTYVPLKNPGEGENYDGPNLDLLVPTDACCMNYTYCCFISDEEGNEVKTVDVLLQARHNYQYFKDYLSDRENPYIGLKIKTNGHFLQCVGEGCGELTRLRPHEDADNDYCCDVCGQTKPIWEVDLTVTVPQEGKMPNYTVVCASPAYYALGSNSSSQYRIWMESDNGVDNWRIMDKTDTFTAGKSYKFLVDLYTSHEREFPIITYGDGSVELNLWGKVNGNYATLKKAYNQDPARYITLEYNFGECNDSVIENIIIDNVKEPVAGQKPNYSATVRGSGYYINTEKNASYDAYWANPPAMWPYIKNGIGWYDVTKGDWVYAHETFIPGHQYRVDVYLKTEEGYNFYHDKWYEMLFNASINGIGATGNTTTSVGLTEQTISATFTCQPYEISTIMLYNLDTPRAGETPDYTMTSAYPEMYQPDPIYAATNGIVWYNSDGSMMEPTDTFVEGEKYQVEIKVIPTQLGGANVCKFASNTVAYIDGKQVVEEADWDAVYPSSNAVYIYYSFKEGALPPKVGAFVGGRITSSGDPSTDITVQLISQGDPEPAYETIVKGNNVDYYFTNVASGTYTLKVSKENHLTATHTIVVTGSDSVIRNCALEALTYIVAYNGNGGIGTMVGDMIEKNGKFTLDPCEYIALPGYQFKAWAIGSLSGPQKQPGEQITITGETYIYAIWEEIPEVTPPVNPPENPPVEPLTSSEKNAKDKLGLTDKGAKEIVAYVEKNKLSNDIIYVTEKTITTQKSEELKEATYSVISAQMKKTTKNKIVVKWNKVSGADGYIVYGNLCGTKNKFKKIKTLGSGVTTYTQKKCKKGTYYKYVVVAYKLVDGKKITIAASKTVHVATSGGKVGNAKAVKVNKTSITIKRKKSFTIKASEIRKDKPIKKHRKIAFESSNPAIATVNAKGKIVGKKKGTCYIYVYAQNGVCEKIKVKVK